MRRLPLDTIGSKRLDRSYKISGGPTSRIAIGGSGALCLSYFHRLAQVFERGVAPGQWPRFETPNIQEVDRHRAAGLRPMLALMLCATAAAGCETVLPLPSLEPIVARPPPEQPVRDVVDVFRPEETEALNTIFERGPPRSVHQLATSSGRGLRVRLEDEPYVSAHALSCRRVTLIEPRLLVATTACRFGTQWRILKPL